MNKTPLPAPFQFRKPRAVQLNHLFGVMYQAYTQGLSRLSVIKRLPIENISSFVDALNAHPYGKAGFYLALKHGLAGTTVREEADRYFITSTGYQQSLAMTLLMLTEPARKELIGSADWLREFAGEQAMRDWAPDCVGAVTVARTVKTLAHLGCIVRFPTLVADAFSKIDLICGPLEARGRPASSSMGICLQIKTARSDHRFTPIPVRPPYTPEPTERQLLCRRLKLGTEQFAADHGGGWLAALLEVDTYALPIEKLEDEALYAYLTDALETFKHDPTYGYSGM